jgi:hypothetical protein
MSRRCLDDHIAPVTAETEFASTMVVPSAHKDRPAFALRTGEGEGVLIPAGTSENDSVTLQICVLTFISFRSLQ